MRTASIRLMFTFWLVFLHAGAVEVAADDPHVHHHLSVSVPHLYYICPEGADATLVCTQSGAKAHPNDRLHRAWLFTPHQDQRCHERLRPHVNGSRAGLNYGAEAEHFWVQLRGVTAADQGRYCCLMLDVLQEKHQIMQRAHSHVLLTVTARRTDNVNCTYMKWGPTPPEGSVAAGLATAACVLGFLCLPFILFLVYKQRQGAERSRRAHELVRMDSEALGHENPVFLGGSPQPVTRTISQIMTRQSSETGRHLLSDPGTPLSPNTHDNVFFPSQDPIPESPDVMQV